MIIDIHTHAFPDAIAPTTIEKLQKSSGFTACTNGTAAGLQASMRRAGVNLSVLLPVATNPRKVEQINTAAAGTNQRLDQTGIASFGCMHPDFPGWYRELERIKNLGMKGIKLHPDYHCVDFDDRRYLDILARAQELELAVLVHAGVDPSRPDHVACTPEMIAGALRCLGPMKLILAHMGGWQHWDSALELLAGRGLYLDTGYCLAARLAVPPRHKSQAGYRLLTDAQLVTMIRTFGSDHVLFATDSPWTDQAQALAHLRRLSLSAEELRAIEGENARKLLKLNCTSSTAAS